MSIQKTEKKAEKKTDKKPKKAEATKEQVKDLEPNAKQKEVSGGFKRETY